MASPPIAGPSSSKSMKLSAEASVEDKDNGMPGTSTSVGIVKRKLPKKVKSAANKNLDQKSDSVSADDIAAEPEAEIDMEPCELNPLLCAPVIDVFMGMLDLATLKQCRQVCQEWNVSAMKAMERTDYAVNLTNIRTIENFNKYMLLKPAFEYTKFRLKSVFTPKMEAHFVEHAINIKTLHIQITAGPKTVGLINFNNIHIILKSTPCLEILTLEQIDFPILAYSTDPDLNPVVVLYRLWNISIRTDFKGTNRAPMLQRNEDQVLEKFFRTAPNLLSLDIDVPRVANFLLYTVRCLMGAIRNIPTIKRLVIKNYLNQDELVLLLGSAFRLQSLVIAENLYDGIPVLVPTFLANQTDIEILDFKVWNVDANTVVEVVLPFIGNLKCLKINDLYCRNFTPKVFPRLNKIEVHSVSLVILRHVFEHFSFVEELTIRTDESCLCGNINFALTGIPAPYWLLNAMNDGVAHSCTRKINNTVIMFLLRAAEPSLRNMRRLKKLELSYLEIPSGSAAGKINDATGFFSLLRMRRLQRLVIRNAAFSDEVISTLHRIHQQVVLLP